MKTLEKGVKYGAFNCKLRTNFIPFPSDYIADFEQVNVYWVT